MFFGFTGRLSEEVMERKMQDYIKAVSSVASLDGKQRMRLLIDLLRVQELHSIPKIKKKPRKKRDYLGIKGTRV